MAVRDRGGALLITLDQPEFTHRNCDIVARWNMRLLELAIEAGCHHVVRRGWYKSTDFWSPALHERFLLPPLRAEARVARQAAEALAPGGGYIMAPGGAPGHIEVADVVERNFETMIRA